MSSDNNASLWGSFITATSSSEFSKIHSNKDLFNRMVVPACFKQCAKTDVDIVFLNEMECAYKCIITYKQAYQVLSDLDLQWLIHVGIEYVYVDISFTLFKHSLTTTFKLIWICF